MSISLIEVNVLGKIELILLQDTVITFTGQEAESLSGHNPRNLPTLEQGPCLRDKIRQFNHTHLINIRQGSWQAKSLEIRRRQWKTFSNPIYFLRKGCFLSSLRYLMFVSQNINRSFHFSPMGSRGSYHPSIGLITMVGL